MSSRVVPEDVIWPDQPANIDAKEATKILYQAKVDVQTAYFQAKVDEMKASWRDAASKASASEASEDALRMAIQAAYLDVAKGNVDRALKRAESVATAAAAIGTVYTTLLGLVFFVGSARPTEAPLPAPGVAAPVFLGLALVLSAFYIAFISPKRFLSNFLSSATGAELQEKRMRTFIEWVHLSTTSRSWALRAAVISLGFGVFLIPLPFLDIDTTIMWEYFWLSVLAFLIIVLLSSLLFSSDSSVS